MLNDFRNLSFKEQKQMLDLLANEKNSIQGIQSHFDPIQVAMLYKDVRISLICALFAYGNAKQIVSFLKKIDFSMLDNAKNIEKLNIKYRFQNEEDVRQILSTLSKISSQEIKDLCENAYLKNHFMLDAINALIDKLYSLNPYRSNGYEFYFGKSSQKPTSAYKRYNMFFRWMVRRDELDFGLFDKINTKDLLIPLDTHTHAMGLKLGLIDRKQADFKAVLELTNTLKKYDENDPIKYDFALYRIGQLNLS